MIFGAEIGLLVYGIIALIRGKFSMGKGKKVNGTGARILGAISLLPLPFAAFAGLVLGFLYPDAIAAGEMKWLLVGIEASILVCTIVVLMLLGGRFHKKQNANLAFDSAL